MRLRSSASALALSAGLLGLYALPAAAAPKVVASIVPLHSLVAAIMDGVGEPELLLRGQNSEHQASYSPQQIEDLGKADVVFIIGEGLELKLTELSGSEAVNGKKFVEMSAAQGLVKLPIRQGGAFEKHDHAHEGEDHAEGEDHDHDKAKAEGAEHAEGEDHDHDKAKAEGAEHAEGEDHDHEHEHGEASFDPHLWLDPVNAKVMAAVIADTLEKADPENAKRYADNEAALVKELDGLSAELTASLAPVKGKPFVVFHDAYQYFEKRFDMEAAGSISNFSASDPSAQRLKEVRDKVKSAKAACVFREPQFSDKAVKIVIEGTEAHDGVLDPIGANLIPGKQAYATLLRNLGGNLKECLSR
jgi:zinc transport system substrate-binding protein